MPVIEVINQQGKKVGEVGVEDRFYVPPKNNGIVHEAVVMQRSSKRQGTASTKTRGLVSGGGRKPWRQKGTGNARAGSSRSPIWKGGGTVFGPQPRNFSARFPKKKMQAAMVSALGSKFRDGKVAVIDSLDLPEPKTKCLVQILKQLGLSGRILIVAQGDQIDLKRAASNLKTVQTAAVEEINVYDLVGADHLLVLKEDYEVLSGAWK